MAHLKIWEAFVIIKYQPTSISLPSLVRGRAFWVTKLKNMEFAIVFLFYAVIFYALLIVGYQLLKYLDKKGIINIDKIIKDLEDEN